MNNFLDHRVAVAAITRGTVRIWAVNDPSGTKPEILVMEKDDQHRNHFKQIHQNAHHGTDKWDREYLDAIVEILAPAKEILLVGHGHGKANEMVKLVQYLERYHPDVAKKVVGAEDTNLEALTDNEILAFAKSWFREPLHAR